MARPSKYRKAFCKELIAHMAQGYSFESFAGKIGVCKQTLYSWSNQSPDFKRAKGLGFAKSRLFWEKLGIDGLFLSTRQFNTAIWRLNMMNRFGWSHNPEDQPETPSAPGLVIQYSCEKCDAEANQST
jgi:hypothetical protein